MTAAALLDRLDHVRQVAPGRWIARCPAHEDKSPSLSLRELDDGRTLVHCFAGCAAPDVLAAVGMKLADLFPAPLKVHSSKTARPNHHWHAAREALKTLHREALIVAIAAENVASGVPLDDTDRARVVDAAAKIRAAVEVVR